MRDTDNRFTELVLIATIAKRYYLDSAGKSDIADELGISRFRVARLLERARRENIVRIEVDTLAASVDYALSEAVRQRYGLRRAVVGFDRQDDVDLDHLGELCAALLAELCGPQDVLGFSWNRAMDAMSRHLRPLPARAIVQLCGAWPGASDKMTSVDLVRTLAGLSRRQAHTFYAPMIVSDREAAEAARRQADFVSAKAMFQNVTIALVGIGQWSETGSTLWGILSPEQRRLTEVAGVVAEMSGISFDRSGSPVESELSALAIGMTAADLADCDEVIATTFGTHRAVATDAVLRGGHVTSLVTHAAAARALLDISD